jgi:hypothetical protein
VIVTAWTNGSGSYGLQIDARGRDKFFNRDWGTVFIRLGVAPGEIEVKVDKGPFWSGTSLELIHRDIGKRLLAKRPAPWPLGHPPKLKLEPVSQRRFQLRF